jgi:hypothetical protein
MAKVALQQVINGADVLVNYTDDIAYVSYDKRIQNPSLDKFIHLFIKSKFGITRIKKVSHTRMKELVQIVEDEKKNVRYANVSFTALIPYIFVARYYVTIPDYIAERIKDVVKTDYYDRWQYTTIVDYTKILGKNEKVRETEEYSIQLRLAKLKLSQLKRIVTNRITNILDKYEFLFKEPDEQNMFKTFKESLGDILFATRKSSTVNKVNKEVIENENAEMADDNEKIEEVINELDEQNGVKEETKQE